MKRLTALLLFVIISVLSLVSCGESTDIPEGMQLVRGSDALGYYFYSPDGWAVANQGGIAATYVSAIDTTSVTLTEASMPSGSIEEYFEAAKADFTFEITLKKQGENFKLGNAEEARQYVYDYKYWSFNQNGEKEYFDVRTMQIFAKFDGRFYIFTFTSKLTERSEGQSYYDFHLENSLKSITDNLKFVKKSGAGDKPSYPELDGYLLVSDRSLSGFDLYVTKDYSVDFSDGIVSVSREDGANITVSKATRAGVSIKEYWENRKRELEAIVGPVTEIKVNNLEGVKLGNLSRAASYEYTYVLDGVDYHVYQIFGVDSFNGYAFTFTAPEAVYENRIKEALDIAGRIKF